MGKSNRRGGARGRQLESVAHNGLLDRRVLLGRGAALAGAMTAGVGASLAGAAAEPLTDPPLTDQPWSLETGAVTPPLQTPSRFEQHVVRTLSNPDNEFRNSHARTPHHLLNGSVTPNSLHFSINHSGLPDIDPEKHRLAIHGLVRQPMVYTLEALSRYPMVSQMAFVECGGNSAPMFSPQPFQATAQALHGLVSCAEWTGVRLSTLLEETGVDRQAKWLIAEGADSHALSRSVPLKKAMDDAMIALYQNGAAPEQRPAIEKSIVGDGIERTSGLAATAIGFAHGALPGDRVLWRTLCRWSGNHRPLPAGCPAPRVRLRLRPRIGFLQRHLTLGWSRGRESGT